MVPCPSNTLRACGSVPSLRGALESHLFLSFGLDDSASAASSMEVTDRIASLEQRVQMQEDDIQLLKSALADVVRRLNITEEQQAVLNRKGPTKGGRRRGTGAALDLLSRRTLALADAGPPQQRQTTSEDQGRALSIAQTITRGGTGSLTLFSYLWLDMRGSLACGYMCRWPEHACGVKEGAIQGPPTAGSTGLSCKAEPSARKPP